MDLDDEILARIKAAMSLNPASKVEDYQVRVTENGTVLLNLKTSRAQLVYDDQSQLSDLEDLNITAN